MENRNIYKLDDFLIILSLILLVPAVFFAWPFLKGLPEASDIAVYIKSAPAVLGNQLLYVLSYLAAAFLTQIAGRAIRYQEKLSLKILDELGYSGKGRIPEVSSRLGMSEAKVRKLVQKLSRVNSLNISLEGDRIIRSRESVKKAAADNRNQLSGAAGAGSQSTIPEKEGNDDGKDKPFGCLGMGILVLLFMTPLWPIPLIIIIRKAIKQRGMSSNKV